eukprot:CAMPEP_0117653606 /NCGR_PEP_ID=MMETSP0804-20121206/3284_1 /TAXON_ID=1074897 /ORGANISM="Tetraselmis astigmatica, Strain CCMP880" /LENGTH=488 /DNA_ID=CAMNT_0005459799 /DNA_START=273 /DNA_END=1738 /DNA_ORIENTATION=-
MDTPTPAVSLPKLNSIKTPRAEHAALMAAIESDEETGSGPKFAGDEDRYFLDGIEEVLAQWKPEVGAMPPIDSTSLKLPTETLGKINTPTAKAKALRAVLRDDLYEESDLETSLDSERPPRFHGIEHGIDMAQRINAVIATSGEQSSIMALCMWFWCSAGFMAIDDAVFLDGLEEVIPDAGEEDPDGEGECEAQAEESRSSQELDVLKPCDIPQVAVSAGHIRAPRWLGDEDATEYVYAEGPSFDEDDALFHEGVEEVVADWSDRTSTLPPAATLKSPFEAAEPVEGASPSISDTFFLEGLEEVSTPAACIDSVGYMPPVDVPPIKSEEKPPRIATRSGTVPDYDPEAAPKWTLEDDSTFMVSEEEAVRAEHVSGSTRPAAVAAQPPPMGASGVEDDSIVQLKCLRLRTSRKHLSNESWQRDTPTNTPVTETAGSGEVQIPDGIPKGSIIPVDPRGELEIMSTTTPYNTPIDSETPNTPVASAAEPQL